MDNLYQNILWLIFLFIIFVVILLLFLSGGIPLETFVYGLVGIYVVSYLFFGYDTTIIAPMIVSYLVLSLLCLYVAYAYRSYMFLAIVFVALFILMFIAIGHTKYIDLGEIYRSDILSSRK